MALGENEQDDLSGDSGTAENSIDVSQVEEIGPILLDGGVVTAILSEEEKRKVESLSRVKKLYDSKQADLFKAARQTLGTATKVLENSTYRKFLKSLEAAYNLDVKSIIDKEPRAEGLYLRTLRIPEGLEFFENEDVKEIFEERKQALKENLRILGYTDIENSHAYRYFLSALEKILENKERLKQEALIYQLQGANLPSLEAPNDLHEREVALNKKLKKIDEKLKTYTVKFDQPIANNLRKKRQRLIEEFEKGLTSSNDFASPTITNVAPIDGTKESAGANPEETQILEAIEREMERLRTESLLVERSQSAHPLVKGSMESDEDAPLVEGEEPDLEDQDTDHGDNDEPVTHTGLAKNHAAAARVHAQEVIRRKEVGRVSRLNSERNDVISLCNQKGNELIATALRSPHISKNEALASNPTFSRIKNLIDALHSRAMQAQNLAYLAQIKSDISRLEIPEANSIEWKSSNRKKSGGDGSVDPKAEAGQQDREFSNGSGPHSNPGTSSNSGPKSAPGTSSNSGPKSAPGTSSGPKPAPEAQLVVSDQKNTGVLLSTLSGMFGGAPRLPSTRELGEKLKRLMESVRENPEFALAVLALAGLISAGVWEAIGKLNESSSASPKSAGLASAGSSQEAKSGGGDPKALSESLAPQLVSADSTPSKADKDPTWSSIYFGKGIPVPRGVISNDPEAYLTSKPMDSDPFAAEKDLVSPADYPKTPSSPAEAVEWAVQGLKEYKGDSDLLQAVATNRVAALVSEGKKKWEDLMAEIKDTPESLKVILAKLEKWGGYEAVLQSFHQENARRKASGEPEIKTPSKFLDWISKDGALPRSEAVAYAVAVQAALINDPRVTSNENDLKIRLGKAINSANEIVQDLRDTKLTAPKDFTYPPLQVGAAGSVSTPDFLAQSAEATGLESAGAQSTEPTATEETQPEAEAINPAYRVPEPRNLRGSAAGASESVQSSTAPSHQSRSARAPWVATSLAEAAALPPDALTAHLKPLSAEQLASMNKSPETLRAEALFQEKMGASNQEIGKLANLLADGKETFSNMARGQNREKVKALCADFSNELKALNEKPQSIEGRKQSILDLKKGWFEKLKTLSRGDGKFFSEYLRKLSSQVMDGLRSAYNVLPGAQNVEAGQAHTRDHVGAVLGDFGLEEGFFRKK